MEIVHIKDKPSHCIDLLNSSKWKICKSFVSESCVIDTVQIKFILAAKTPYRARELFPVFGKD